MKDDEAKRDRSARAQPTTNNPHPTQQHSAHCTLHTATQQQQHTHRQQAPPPALPSSQGSPSSIESHGLLLARPSPADHDHDRRHNKYGIPNACKRCHPDHNCIGTIPHIQPANHYPILWIWNSSLNGIPWPLFLLAKRTNHPHSPLGDPKSPHAKISALRLLPDPLPMEARFIDYHSLQCMIPGGLHLVFVPAFVLLPGADPICQLISCLILLTGLCISLFLSFFLTE